MVGLIRSVNSQSETFIMEKKFRREGANHDQESKNFPRQRLFCMTLKFEPKLQNSKEFFQCLVQISLPAR